MPPQPRFERIEWIPVGLDHASLEAFGTRRRRDDGAGCLYVSSNRNSCHVTARRDISINDERVDSVGWETQVPGDLV